MNLGMEGHRKYRPLADGDGVPLELGEHRDAVAGVVHPRSADEHAVQRAALDPLQFQVGLEAATCRPKALRLAVMSSSPRWSRSSIIQAAHAPSTGVPAPTSSRSGSASPSRSIPSVIVVDSPPGITRASRPAEARHAGVRTSRASAPRPSIIRAWASKSPWSARTPTSKRRLPTSVGQQAARGLDLVHPDAGHRRAQIAGGGGDAGGILEVCGGLHHGRGGALRSSDLKMPEPTNTPSAPRRIISAASAGVAMSPAENRTTGSRPFSATSCTRSSGAWRFLAAAASSFGGERAEAADIAPDRAHVAHRLHHVAGAGLALAADHRRALCDTPQRLPEVGGAAHERHLERPLVDVVGLVGGRDTSDSST